MLFRSGLLAEPGDADGLAQALGRLVADADLRRRIGAAGHDRLRARFDQEPELDRLATKLREAAASR